MPRSVLWFPAVVFALSSLGPGCVYNDECIPPASRVNGVCALSAGDGGRDGGPDGGIIDGGGTDGGGTDADMDAGPPPRITAISAGAAHICVAREGQAPVCWGSNLFAQIGSGTVGENHVVAAPVIAGDIVELQGTALHTCARTNDGRMFCWGANDRGQIDSDVTQAEVRTPVEIALAVTPTRIAAGFANTCASAVTSGLRCWGRTDQGQLTGVDNSPPVGTPGVEIETVIEGMARPIESIFNVAIADRHFCARATGGDLFCWGTNDSGQLGDGTTLDRAGDNAVDVTPTAEDGVVESIAAAFARTCAIIDGRVFCWGDNNDGTLLPGEPEAAIPSPTELAGVTDAVEVVLGEAHACARTMDGGVRCWGSERDGRLGRGMNMLPMVSPPESVMLPAGRSATRIVAGIQGFTCAVLDETDLYCWGLSALGSDVFRTGATDTEVAPTPVQVPTELER